ncbi:MAG TPA: right-handed parallel beta-helix repeat-containing protein, partial [Thermoanaerobaculia bacterium]
ELRIHADEPDFNGPFDQKSSGLLYRTFLVTTSADDGDGSLRAAIAAANAADCYLKDLDGAPACAIQFNIGEASARPWKTIRLRSPLPFIGAYSLRIDGATQTAFSGVTNPDGPPIEISGGGTVDGAGLDAGTCSVTIAHLAINGFLGNGISLRNFNGVSPFFCTTSIQGNYIGTDPTGSVAVPNYRGIGIIQSNSPFFFGSVISGNVLSGNIRSGLFAEAGIWDIRENRIGVKAHSDEPLPNGASGIYLDRGVYRIEVSFNVIGFNREMGIAVDPGTLYAHITYNLIWGNGGLAIDDGLDGPSVSVTGDNGPINVPVLTSAVYDPAKNQTTIRGSSSSGSIQVFVSDAAGPAGSGDAQRLLGSSSSGGGDFALTVPGDLRGQWVSATVTVFGKKENPYPDVFSYLRTTELSRALQVH